MLMTVLDLMITAYQGILLIHVIRRQFEQRQHSFVYEVISVIAFVAFFAIIQYLSIPVPEVFVAIVFSVSTMDAFHGLYRCRCYY